MDLNSQRMLEPTGELSKLSLTNDSSSDDHHSIGVDSTPSEDDMQSTRSNGSGSTGSKVGSDRNGIVMDQSANNRVFCTKALVFAMLLIAAAACGTATYLITSREEEEAFQNEMENLSNEIVDVSRINAQASVATITGMATTLTSFTEHFYNPDGDENFVSAWPFVTIPDFQLRAETVTRVSHAQYIGLSPFVPLAQKEDWENFTDSTLSTPPYQPSEHNMDGMDHSNMDGMDHSNMDGMDHSNMDGMDHSNMDGMDHSNMDGMDHSNMDGMDHSNMDGMDHSNMDDMDHSNMDDMDGSNMDGMDHSNMDGMDGMDDSNMDGMVESNMDGMDHGTMGHGRRRLNHMNMWDHFDNHDLYAPVSQISPITPETSPLVNSDLFYALPGSHETVGWMMNGNTTAISDLQLLQAESVDLDNEATWPQSYIMEPIFHSLEDPDERYIVGFLTAVVPWHSYFMNLMPEGTKPITVVLESFPKEAGNSMDTMDHDMDDMDHSTHGFRDVTAATCGKMMTYEVIGPKVKFLGIGDLHSDTYDKEMIMGTLDLLDPELIPEGACQFMLHMYPSNAFANSYLTNSPLYYTLTILGVFALTSLVFIAYDQFVKRRQTLLMSKAVRSNAILHSLFPTAVKERLMQEQEEKEDAKKKGGFAFRNHGNNQGIADVTGHTSVVGKPIADLFPSATVMFADIAGFTAWSSTRDPAQVFTLLETIYSSFDAIAKKRKVFKVETIGDCYVACCGLPEPREDHAETMATFAQECRAKMNAVVQKLEVTLGPDTSDLAIRIGLNSGAVTAGVLRGEKSRFQLFGDTVNTTARIESTGERDRIHLSHSTAEILIKAGKGHLVTKRKDLVKAKGKGELQTYWLSSSSKQAKRQHSSGSSDAGSGRDSTNLSGSVSDIDTNAADLKMRRLIQWNVDVLSRQLKRILAMREVIPISSRKMTTEELEMGEHGTGNQVLDEVKEIIPLSNKAQSYKLDPESVVLPSKVVDQLTDYVSEIANLYHDDNPFHCFEHCSHVVQSTVKLLSRVVQSEHIDYNEMAHREISGEALHDNTFGITSDPIIQFALAYSALIHDVDHTGVPNATLVAEGSRLAEYYNNKSVAEQNSVDLAWELLQEPAYADLRACIYQTQEELERFRQLVVNAVMATDICDKELGALRKERWNKAFSEEKLEDDDITTTVNRKATIVIEHLIQASDVSHTMQHWHVYLKWNEKLFDELMKAYLEGRSETNPADGWYKGEIGFFDFYIIPLAKKLKDCGVFGVSSDEYLDYAMANRKEWLDKGESVVARYMEKYNNLNAESSE